MALNKKVFDAEQVGKQGLPSETSTEPACKQPKEHFEWALLLPTTSRGASGPDKYWIRLEDTAKCLLDSIPSPYCSRTTIHVAIDI